MAEIQSGESKSPSAAAGFVGGTSLNGKVKWIDDAEEHSKKLCEHKANDLSAGKRAGRFCLFKSESMQIHTIRMSVISGQ